MTPVDLSPFYHKPCKYKLRSGKEVFGVIWLEDTLQPHHYFSSTHVYDEALKASMIDAHPIVPREKIEIDIMDVISAEYLSETA